MKQAIQGRVTELDVWSGATFANPFWDLDVCARLTPPDGGEPMTVHGFYDGADENGEQIWRLRWTPPSPGRWRCSIGAEPASAAPDLARSFDIEVTPGGTRGFMRTDPARAWGFVFDDGSAYLPLGDTIYNLFGGRYCGLDVRSILERRKEQGVNYVRARMQVSPYHPDRRSAWQTRDCWPWQGSAQWPDFTRFNLDYFRAVDETVELAGELGIGLELILEAWMLEFPFNERSRFLPEDEEHWIRYIVDRYAAYPQVYVWCPANEYDLYPGNTDKTRLPEANRWLKRLAALIKSRDPYLRPVGAHQWVQNVPLHERLGDSPDIDIYLVQSDWFKEIATRERNPSLCLWIEDQLLHHAPGREKAKMCSEFGYERAPGSFTVKAHDWMDEHHTRRGQWRAAFAGFPVVHGFNNTWGPQLTLEGDSTGTRYLRPFYRFMTEICPYEKVVPMPDLVESGPELTALECPALCLGASDASVVAVYLPVPGTCCLPSLDAAAYEYSWYDPRTGEQAPFKRCETMTFAGPGEGKEMIAEGDWTLLLRKTDV